MCELIVTCVESHPNPKRAHLYNVKSITFKKRKEVHDPTGYFMIFISGGRPKGSKRNLKFQSAMWQHFKHFQSKDFFSCCLSFTALELFCHNYMKNP
jgi:hypothetical protein